MGSCPGWDGLAESHDVPHRERVAQRHKHRGLSSLLTDKVMISVGEGLCTWLERKVHKRTAEPVCKEYETDSGLDFGADVNRGGGVSS